MTTIPAIWHHDLVINGEPYPTRHFLTDSEASTNTEDYHGDLTNEQRDAFRAVHESAHAVATLAAGGHVHYAEITTTAELKKAAASRTGIPGGNVFGCNLNEGQAFAVFLGAGERAEDYWLRQNNLWTRLRAVGVELGAYGDRQHFLANNPHFGFGADHNDYRVVHDLADELVAQHWDAITTVADALATQLYLTGQQIADLAQLPNGTHAASCTFAPSI